MKVKYPKVKFDSKQRIYVTFYLNNKRYRLFNGKKINCEIYPNSFPIKKRLEMGSLLAAEVYKFITSGLSFNRILSFHYSFALFVFFFQQLIVATDQTAVLYKFLKYYLSVFPLFD